MHILFFGNKALICCYFYPAHNFSWCCVVPLVIVQPLVLLQGLPGLKWALSVTPTGKLPVLVYGQKLKREKGFVPCKLIWTWKGTFIYGGVW